ncbi:54S ribosomal protein L11, mitochondrial [[Candida] railenensis]|uniref:54S ribosomal protein L11, mitochondrial n=1 Tax=[Candida] railenensis TaxID=45579 RepID=A0A9P0VW62_9ASCO|nr:54S ribosomal protein L11, mitochondrial [[Candida] railenensis]
MKLLASVFGGLRISALPKPFQVAPRLYSTAAASSETGAKPFASGHNLDSILTEKRKTTKHILSRKTFLVDYYTHLNRTNEIVLYVHHNNLVKTENKKFRTELSKNGAKLTLIRNSIYNVFLKSENEADPADEQTSKKNKDVKHPIAPLLNGPTAIITVPKCEPQVVEKILKTLKGANEKLILIGAKIEQQVFNIDQVDEFKKLPSKEDLQAQLLGTLTVLGGSGLVQVLETPAKLLYLTGKELVKMNEEESD